MAENAALLPLRSLKLLLPLQTHPGSPFWCADVVLVELFCWAAQDPARVALFTTACGVDKPTISFLASSGNLISETEYSALQVAMGLYFSPIISVLLTDKNVRECRSKTKSKNWEKCGQTALMTVKLLMFTQDFCNFWGSMCLFWLLTQILNSVLKL